MDRNGCFQATAQEGLVSICLRRKARYFNLFLQKLPKILVSSRYTVTTLRSAHLLGLHGCQVTQNTELESAPLPPCPVFMTFKHSFVFIFGIAGPYSNSISFPSFLSFVLKEKYHHLYRGSHFLLPPTVPRASYQHGQHVGPSFLKGSCSDGCEVVSNCGFDLHFSCEPCIEFMLIDLFIFMTCREKHQVIAYV